MTHHQHPCQDCGGSGWIGRRFWDRIFWRQSGAECKRCKGTGRNYPPLENREQWESQVQMIFPPQPVESEVRATIVTVFAAPKGLFREEET